LALQKGFLVEFVGMLCVVCFMLFGNAMCCMLMLFGNAFPKVWLAGGHCTFDALGLALFSECKDGCSATYMDALEKNIEKLFGL
jgi:hypothetical protein